MNGKTRCFGNPVGCPTPTIYDRERERESYHTYCHLPDNMSFHSILVIFSVKCIHTIVQTLNSSIQLT